MANGVARAGFQAIGGYAGCDHMADEWLPANGMGIPSLPMQLPAGNGRLFPLPPPPAVAFISDRYPQFIGTAHCAIVHHNGSPASPLRHHCFSPRRSGGHGPPCLQQAFCCPAAAPPVQRWLAGTGAGTAGCGGESVAGLRSISRPLSPGRRCGGAANRHSSVSWAALLPLDSASGASTLPARAHKSGWPFFPENRRVAHCPSST